MRNILEKIKAFLFGERSEYPQNQNEEAVYTEFPLYYLDEEDDTPTNEVKAYMYVLSCPIYGNEVKRSHIYCSKCRNKLSAKELI